MKQSPTQSQRRNKKIARQHLHQGGFTLVEVFAVIVVIGVLVMISMPAIKGLFVQARVGPAAAELQRFMTATRLLGEGDSVSPYAAINNVSNLAPALMESSVFKVNGATVAHRLGGSGAGSNGTITIGPVALGGGSAGSGFGLTLTNVNHRACPGLATTLNSVSETISVNGTAAKTLGTNNEPGSFNAVTAQDLCVKGDNNTFVFATR
ncbi:type 4 pilus major pilin [Achromobacter aegrifaciens]|uniref:type 4 pilus major pilin n=1 Tax=Achromobacter aegrifaciens TaxID=1287736 RepID=UPI0027BB21BF|nr:type 4 pilus major pilin [Achromobacter aegrifaciens]WLW63626.1 type 4 pilus major pilin [Achromobacter aegrifaciens]